MLLPEVRTRFSAVEQVLLDNLEVIIKVLQRNAKRARAVDLNEEGTKLFNRYVTFAVALYTAKFKDLYEALADSLNRGRYLIYAHTGRAIVETAASLRFHVRHPDVSALRNAKGDLSAPVLEKAINVIDQLVRGSGDSSKAFATFQESQGSAGNPESAPVEVQVFLADWYEESPRFRELHETFCRLTKADVAGNLPLMRVRADSVAGSEKVTDDSAQVVGPTLAGLIGAYRVIQENLSSLQRLRVRDSK